MSVEMTFYRCVGLRVESSFPENANGVSLEISYLERRDGEARKIEIVLYELPKAITDKLVLAFGDPATLHHKRDKAASAEPVKDAG